jgi:hypothetical protein
MRAFITVESFVQPRDKASILRGEGFFIAAKVRARIDFEVKGVGIRLEVSI